MISNKRSEEEIRNLSNTSFEIIPAEWNAEQKKEIEAIRKKYDIPTDFNLAEYLSMLPIKFASFIEAKKQIPTIKETHLCIDAINQKTNELMQILHFAGPIILSKISRNTENGLITIDKIQKNLPQLFQGCIITKAQLPRVKAGRHRDPLKLALINVLVEIYMDATAKKPTCGYDDIGKTHTGECYEFLVDLNAHILKSQNLQIDKISTIGQYLHETLKDRKTKLKKAYIIIIACLINPAQINPSVIPLILTRLENASLSLKVHFLIT